jgi:hypothetical protein
MLMTRDSKGHKIGAQLLSDVCLIVLVAERPANNLMNR